MRQILQPKDLSAGGASQKLATALLKHPDVNTLFVTSDALLQQVLPAIRELGRKNLSVIANEGFAGSNAGRDERER